MDKAAGGVAVAEPLLVVPLVLPVLPALLVPLEPPPEFGAEAI